MDREVPQPLVTHFSRTKSDQCPMFLQLDNTQTNKGENPFRMEPMWCAHPTFEGLVQECFAGRESLRNAMTIFQKYVMEWNKATIGNIFSKMRRILATLYGIQNPPPTTLEPTFKNLKTPSFKNMTTSQMQKRLLKNEIQNQMVE